MCSSELDFRLLGQLSATRDGQDIALGGPRQRLVLALLLMNAGRPMAPERLVDEIWGEVAPGRGTGSLRTYVWRLRRLLNDEAEASSARAGTRSTGGTDGPDAGPLVMRGAGYLLDIEPEQIDSVRYERLFVDARSAAAAGQPEQALPLLDEALALWRGPAFGDLANESAVQHQATRLEQLRLGSEELRAELLLATGRHVESADELGVLARSHPERERLWAMYMTALYRSGRQGDALRCFQEARELLVDEIGLDPGPELRDLEAAILRQEPALEWRPRPSPPLGTGGPAADRDASPGGEARHNLPRQLTSFVGRSTERAMVAGAIEESGLVTLAGSGGSGKTRLALAVAQDLVEEFADGVWFVDLAAVTDPGLIARAVAGPLGVETDQPGQIDHICRRIGDEQVLLVLDNCEHVVENAAEVAEQLLVRCPELRILATSREELRVAGEAVWRVPALSLPPSTTPADAAGPDEVLRSEAVALFIERGRSVVGGFAPAGAGLDAVAGICRQLDGIPLAIELVAALVGTLPLADIAERLGDRMPLLDTSRRQGAPRHRTLRATVDWSFDLLDEGARDVFVRLGVFVGDFTLAAAERVAGPQPDPHADPLAVVRGLGRLVATSMVGCVSGSDGAVRYRMLETMRQYAREKLEQLDDAAEVHARHAIYYAEFAAEAERHVHGAAGSEWLARVVTELPNLRAAVARTFDHEDVEVGLQLAGSLRWFFARMALLDDAARWLDVGLKRSAELSPELQLMALTAASTVAWMQGDFSRSGQLGEESVTVAREVGDDHQLAIALIVRGAALVYEGRLGPAEECFVEARVLCTRLGDRWGMGWMLANWATASRRAGRPDLSRQQLEEALAIFRELRDQHGQVLPLVNLALGAQEQNRLEEARGLADEAATLAAALGDRQLQHVSLCVLGRVELSLGHHDRARELLVRSIRGFPGAHNRMMLAIAFEGLAGLSGVAGCHGDAAALLGFTQAIRERWKISLSGSRARELDGWLDDARRALGDDDAFSAELVRGAGLDLDEAVVLAESATGTFARPADRSDVEDDAVDDGVGGRGLDEAELGRALPS